MTVQMERGNLTVKTCVQCGVSKPVAQFERNNDKRKTYHYYSQGCRDCLNAARQLLRKLKRGADRLTIQERFEQYFVKGLSSECWNWTGGRGTYTKGIQHSCGEFNVEINGKRRPEPSYRTSWKLYKGVIPDGAHVLHRCDNRLCVNPEHLFLGSHQDNMNDMMAKGRHPVVALGEAHKWSKLTAVDVIAIRQSTDTYPALASKFGVTRENIYAIKSHKTWKHIGVNDGR